MGCASIKVSKGTGTDVVAAAPLPFDQSEASKTWMVRIEKKDDLKFGFKTELIQEGLLIVSINHHGCLAQWNEEHASDIVRPGDVIVSLNGERVCTQIIKAMRSQILDLQIRRTVTHRVKRTDQHLILASHLKFTDTRKWRKLENLTCVCAEEAKSCMCAICLDEYEDPSEKLLELPCKHAFHPSCVMPWFDDGKLECPLCKQSLYALEK